MGMHDNIKFKADCWKCGKPLSNFQSKTGECLMEELNPKQIAGGNFYTLCSCFAWNEYDVIAKEVEIVFNEKESKLRTR